MFHPSNLTSLSLFIVLSYAHLSTEYRTLKAAITDLEQMISESKDKSMR